MNISNSLKLKSADSGYDLDLFFTVLMNCAKFYMPVELAVKFIEVTSKTINILNNVKSINKLMLFDSWLCSVNEVNLQMAKGRAKSNIDKKNKCCDNFRIIVTDDIVLAENLIFSKFKNSYDSIKYLNNPFESSYLLPSAF